MNNAGDVVGWSYYYPSDGSVYAIMFVFHAGQLSNLRALDGGWGSSGAAINDDRVVVGTSAAADGYFPPYPFSWQNGVMSSLFGGIPSCDLGTGGANVDNCRGVAADINSHGEIVGQRTVVGTATDQAFVYRAGSFTDLGITGTATAVNDRGDIVGTTGFVPTGSLCCGQDLVNREGGDQAFLYTHGDIHFLGSLGGPLSGANDISDNGRIVGFSDTADGQRHAFLLTKGAGMRDLGTLGGSFSEARAINRSGTIVVGDSTTATGELHGFVYANGRMVDLNDLISPAGAGRLIDAQDVNDAGQIAGRMAFGSDPDDEGQAVLLRPQ
jgi:probable HAF family extracellular repeat protein